MIIEESISGESWYLILIYQQGTMYSTKREAVLVLWMGVALVITKVASMKFKVTFIYASIMFEQIVL